MSRFDKYFSNIQNKESRFYRRLQDLDDLVYDRYFNEFSGKTSFIAEVLSETNQDTAAEGQGGNSTLYLPIRVRIDGIHTNQIPDPYKEVQALQGEEAAAKFRTLLLSHPLAFPDTEIYSDSAASQPLNRGDRIEVFFAEEGPQNYGRQRGLKYRKVVEPAIARTVPTGANIAEIFDQKDITSIGDVEAQYFNKSAAIAFIDRLAATSYFQGYSIPALAGVAANASAESNFVFDAAGDKRVAGAAERSIETRNGISGKTGKYCSFGFFQLNVCGTGAEGMLIAKSKSYMNSDGVWNENGKEQFLDWLTDLNGINQLSYVGPRLKNLGLPIGTDSAYEFGDLMTTKFEQPINKELKGRERGATAEKILEAYNKSKEEQQ